MTDHRRAFSLLEMTVAIGAVTLLSGMTAPGIFRALRQGTVNDSAQAVKMTAELAQGFAMRAGPQVLLEEGKAWGQGLQDRYGVRVVPATAGQPAHVVLLRGSEEASPRRILSDSVDLRAWKTGAPDVVTDTNDLQLITAPQTWWYSWRTGLPVDQGGLALAKPIVFTVATRDYEVRKDGAAIIQRGIANELVLFLRTGVVRAQ